MTTWIEDIKRLAANEGGEVTRQWLEDAEQASPYCVLPQLLFLRHNGVKGNEDVLARLSIAFPDRRALALMLGDDSDLLSGFYPPEALPETPDTFTTIDRFLDNYGKTTPGEIEAIDRAIFNPQPDYADVLAAQEMKEGGMQLDGGDSQDEDDDQDQPQLHPGVFSLLLGFLRPFQALVVEILLLLLLINRIDVAHRITSSI